MFLPRSAALIACIGVAFSFGQPASAQTQAPAHDCSALAAQYPGLKDRNIVVGITPGFASYATIDPENPDSIIGIEPSLIEQAATCLGFKVSYSQSDWSGLIPSLQSGRINLVSGGMYASAERAQQINFVQYMKAGQSSLVAAGNPKGITSLEEACGVTAAEAAATVENEILAAQSDDCVAAGKGEITPLVFPTNDRAFDALAQGRADIFLTDAGVAAYLAQTSPDRVQIGFAIISDFVFGLGVKKGDDELLNGLEAVFQGMYDDGSLNALMTTWGFTAEQSFEPAVKTE